MRNDGCAERGNGEEKESDAVDNCDKSYGGEQGTVEVASGVEQRWCLGSDQRTDNRTDD